MYIVCLINLNGYKLDKYLNPERFACVSDLRSIDARRVNSCVCLKEECAGAPATINMLFLAPRAGFGNLPQCDLKRAHILL